MEPDGAKGDVGGCEVGDELGDHPPPPSPYPRWVYKAWLVQTLASRAKGIPQEAGQST